MAADVLKALLTPFAGGQLTWPSGEKLLFLNGRQCEGLPEKTVIQQYFKPAEAAVPEIPAGRFDIVLVRGSKQHRETLYLLGQGLAKLPDDGILVCAAANDAGGRRLKSDLKGLGLAVESLAKYKSQVVWTYPGGVKALQWVKEGQMQPVLDGAFVSQPGIFGWDRIDTGSALLTKYLPAGTLKGIGADFGCGYGYLAAEILQHQPGVREIFCLDADYRAVTACKTNLAPLAKGQKLHCRWTDLTKKQADLPPLDWIVMNPPFHQGKSAQYSIGTDFIKTAAAALRPGGALWMVANAHLPYETVLDVCFETSKKITEEQGFKVFHACK